MAIEVKYPESRESYFGQRLLALRQPAMDDKRYKDISSDQSHLVDLHSGDQVRRRVLITTRQTLLSVPLSL